ncbi:MAG: hypothetical protein KGI51_12160 [Rhodospirillales bacterium]|nr:hypothetical protein [Rhodospirillales bacterium]
MTTTLRRHARALAMGAVLLGGALTPTLARAEPHPVIREGLERVNAAIAILQHGAHDFHGHRVAAIRALMAARRQLIAAMRYDRH